jgi:imidazolonepropionase
MGELGLIADGSLLIDGQTIEEVGSTRRIENLSKARKARLFDVSGKVVAPGFVDSHTRLLSLPSPRAVAKALDPLDARGPQARGSSSLGGSSLRSLRLGARAWTYRLAANGTTTIEIRLGGGSSGANPMRGLRAILAIDQDPISVAATISVGASALADDPVGAVREVIRNATRRGRMRLAYACEIDSAAAWPPEVCQAIGELCRTAGVEIKILDRSGVGMETTQRAVCLGARSLEGFGSDWDDQRQADLLAESRLVATLVPESPRGGVRFRAPVGRGLIDRGAAVCLATGFGAPDRPTLNMAWAMGVACREMHLSAAEAFTAATLNGAAAMCLADSVGSIEPGKCADLTVFDVADYREIPYFLGVNLCLATIKSGRVIYHAGTPPPPRPHGEGSSR